MVSRNVLRRRGLPAVGLGLVLAFAGGLAIGAGRAAAQSVVAQKQVSQNWSGYVVTSKSGQNYSSVSSSWVQPSLNSNSTTQGASAFWVGLGGAGDSSQALEQVGTSADYENGQATYYAWYELVPAAQQRLNLAVNPGDHMTGKVTVNGSEVTVSLSDQTTGQSVTKTLHMDNPDTSSAEWIAEAPALESQAGTQILPLADFGAVTFTGASATAGGETGSISDPNWNVEQIDMGSGGGGQLVPGGGQYDPAGLSDVAQTSTAGASAGSVSSDGTSFTVSYSPDGSSAQATGGTQPSDGTQPGNGYGYGDPGYGYPGGYVYPGGYIYIYGG